MIRRHSATLEINKNIAPKLPKLSKQSFDVSFIITEKHKSGSFNYLLKCHTI